MELIGVQGYEFKGQLSVPDAIKELQIDYPVAHDEEKAIWRAYGVRLQPAHALIGPDGTIVSRGTGRVTMPDIQRQVEAVLLK